MDHPCSTPEHHQFDFWLGKWELTWEGGQGTNLIEKILDMCVIQETFDGGIDLPLKGRSFSVYDRQRGCWCQTWVDNSGGYLDFTGGLEQDRMILSRISYVEEQPVHQRMVWYEIQPNSFRWNWEKSTDGGATWEPLWEITYRRVG